MEILVFFRIAQSFISLVFAFLISDIRKKTHMTPLINEKCLHVLQICCLIPAALYAYTLITMDYLSSSDLVALTLTSFGTLIAGLGKITLAEKHTWTGYHLETTKSFLSKGIYAYIRHPLYTGVYVFIFGTICTFVAHLPYFLTAASLASLAYTMSFLAVAAARETKLLAREFGDEFLNYQAQVHACFPLRKYRKPVPKINQSTTLAWALRARLESEEIPA